MLLFFEFKFMLILLKTFLNGFKIILILLFIKIFFFIKQNLVKTFILIKIENGKIKINWGQVFTFFICIFRKIGIF